MIFGKKVNIKKYLIANPSKKKRFLKSKINFYDHQSTDFHDKEMSRVGSNYTYLVLLFNFFKKMMKNIICDCF